MRKLLYLFGFLAIVSFDLSAHNSEEGVVIAGVRWATRNVDAPGTFAQNPEDTGQFYQWGRQQGWAATGAVSNWNSSISSDSGWLSADDPCPTGWRVPTADELRSLRDAGGEWTTKNGVYGMLFGIAPNQIFLPAVGERRGSDGRLFRTGIERGHYWSSTRDRQHWTLIMGLSFDSHWRRVVVSSSSIDNGHSIRCVAID